MNCYFLESTAFAKLFVLEPGTEALIRLMEAVEDNRKLIAASAPLEVYAAIRRRERAGDITSTRRRSSLRNPSHRSRPHGAGASESSRSRSRPSTP